MRKIIEAVATTNERSNLMDFLDQLRDKSYSLDFDVKSYLANAPRSAYLVVSEIFEFAFSQGRDSFLQTIETAQKDLNDSPVVTLTVAIEPSDRLAWNIKQWFKNELGRDVLIHFEMDKSLIGGAIIESNGHISEFSFKQYFERKKN